MNKTERKSSVYFLTEIIYNPAGYSESSVITVFNGLPSVEVLAPFIDGLPSHMGKALAHIIELKTAGETDINNCLSYELKAVEFGKDLRKGK
jgi:hypothetical protein